MGTVRLDPVLARALGLDPSTQSPDAIVVAMLKQQTSLLRSLQNRSVARAKLSTITVTDADAKTPGQQHARIDLRAGVTDDFGKVGMKIAAFVTHSPACAGIMVDEARRMAMGLPQGPPAHSLDDPHLDSEVSDTTLAVMGHGARNLFGVDDAIIIGAVLTVGVPLLIALIPVVLPMLEQLGKACFDFITTTVTGKPPDDPAADAKAAADAAAAASSAGGAFPGSELFDQAADAVGVGTAGVDDSTMGVAIVAAALIAGYFLLKRFRS